MSVTIEQWPKLTHVTITIPTGDPNTYVSTNPRVSCDCPLISKCNKKISKRGPDKITHYELARTDINGQEEKDANGNIVMETYVDIEKTLMCGTRQPTPKKDHVSLMESADIKISQSPPSASVFGGPVIIAEDIFVGRRMVKSVKP